MPEIHPDRRRCLPPNYSNLEYLRARDRGFLFLTKDPFINSSTVCGFTNSYRDRDEQAASAYLVNKLFSKQTNFEHQDSVVSDLNQALSSLLDTPDSSDGSKP